MNLFELAFTCYVYDSMSTFNKSYKSFLKDIGNNIDLFIPEHRKALIIWLNRWGCRQFSLNYHEMASQEILNWYKEGYIKSIPQDKKLWEMTGSELDLIANVFDTLASRKASYKIRKDNKLLIKVGSTGASKILFALRPEIAIPWDEAIRKSLKYLGDGNSYVNYLKNARSEIESLINSCEENDIDLHEIPKTFERDEATIAQLVGEYFWVKKTRECKPPSNDTIKSWARWSHYPEKTVPSNVSEIEKVNAFVGGYMGKSYQTEINTVDCSAIYTVLDNGYKLLLKEAITLSKKEMKKFLEALENVKLFEWERNYEDMNVLDGTNWSVEVNEESLSFSGSNAYPENWEGFCSAIEDLLQRNFS